ncbi:glutamate racemase [Parvibium lacunae]|uniref:Glutamate racemase n=1 Tax=Parvibium lacunae TaxID=1888893 RepID=A0A368L6H2_9BURK|nr:glutamate racemase [Parvibium lacunae]RCS59253.1 glutamate racemase [Parvibium lacunae]
MTLSLDPNGPIGVFDSGVGGLTVLRALQAQLPHERFIYVADNGHAPYGDKSPEFITERSEKIAAFLQAEGAKALVIACNTATAAAAQQLRTRWPAWPIIGIEPAVKPATMLTKTGVVGILATTNTLASEKFRQLVARFADNAKVVVQACPGLVDEIEQGHFDSPRLQSLLTEYIGALQAAQADVIVLGCTHYPFVRKQIQAIAGSDVQIIETGQAVARELRRRLNEENILAPQSSQGMKLYSTGKTVTLERIASQYCGLSQAIERVI